ncbi:MAG: hypothetical protein QW091_01770 [Candidatus Micrarchaeaceae archaeon]
MAFFDIANFEVSAEVAKLLGFKRILKTSDVCSGGNALIVRGVKELSLSAVRRHASPTSLGIESALASHSRIEESALHYLAERGKLLVINAGSLTFANTEQLPVLVRRGRWLYAHSAHVGLPIAIATFAESKSALLSSAQLLRIATLFGADFSTAKQMLSMLGSVVA